MVLFHLPLLRRGGNREEPGAQKNPAAAVGPSSAGHPAGEAGKRCRDRLCVFRDAPFGAEYASALRGPSGGPSAGRLRGGRSCADGGRVVVRHSPAPPGVSDGSGHRSALPQDPLLPEDAAPRSPPNLPRSREERSAPLPEPISARLPTGSRGTPSRRSPTSAGSNSKAREAGPAPSAVRAPCDAHDGRFRPIGEEGDRARRTSTIQGADNARHDQHHPHDDVPAWQDHVSHGDIVSFRFPLAEEASTGQPKARPCLILDIEVRGGQRYALLAYGTTSRRRSNVGYEIHVRRRAEYLSAGLDEPTRFVGARRLLVPLTHSGFAICRATGSAVLGRLDGAPFEAMNAVRGRIHAEADIAADRRSRRRRAPPARPRTSSWSSARRDGSRGRERRCSNERRTSRGRSSSSRWT